MGTDFNDWAADMDDDEVLAALDDVPPHREAPPDTSEPGEAPTIRATPFVWRDPATLPRRAWLYGRHLARRYVSATVAAGGVGKSSLTLAEALAMVSGRDLFNVGLPEPLRVWMFNLEDPREELDRRIAAAVIHHGIDPAVLDGRLYVDSGREQPLCLAEETPNGAKIVMPLAEALIAEITARKIDVVRIDPFVSSHAVNENDNRAIDLVVKEWARIADKANCAIELVHHTRKQMPGVEVNADSGRGAKALVDASRSTRVLARMTGEEGERAGVENHRLFFRMSEDKQNLAPPSENAVWAKLVNVHLPNGDDVGVVVPWAWPDPFENITPDDLRAVRNAIAGKGYRKDVQAKNWAGRAIAEVLGLDADDKAEKNKIKALIKTWIKTGVLIVSEGKDLKGNIRPVIEIGRLPDA